MNESGPKKDGLSTCYSIHHDIGRGTVFDDDNFNKPNSPGMSARIMTCFYCPLVTLEVSYWTFTRPRYIYETVGSD